MVFDVNALQGAEGNASFKNANPADYQDSDAGAECGGCHLSSCVDFRLLCHLAHTCDRVDIRFPPNTPAMCCRSLPVGPSAIPAHVPTTPATPLTPNSKTLRDAAGGSDHVLVNLIDSPGHVDFSAEGKRRCWGAQMEVREFFRYVKASARHPLGGGVQGFCFLDVHLLSLQPRQ